MTGPSRRAILRLLPALAVAACADDEGPPRDYPPLAFDYLTKIQLNVAALDFDDRWAPRGGSRQLADLAPVPPLQALLRMGHDRLVTAGSTGHATFVVDDASIVRTPGGYAGNFAVALELTGGDGARTGYAEARVSRTTASSGEESPGAVRDALYELTRKMMDDMNVEFEYQVRRSLHDYIQPTAAQAPPTPVPVQAQDLGAPQ